jgi:DNA adenine methylase
VSVGTAPIKAPFPYFGGKARSASMVWERFGSVDSYVEPFFGSGAVLFGSPDVARYETINDMDGLICNFWRAVQADPEEVAYHADWPVIESDLHARHSWLVGQKEVVQARMEGSPDYYDAKVAGWWVWGMSCWIGSGFCSGQGPWQSVDGELVHLGNVGRGVKRQLVHLGNAGRGVNRQLDGLTEYMQAIADRLRGVRVCCGDWSRVCGPTPLMLSGNGPVGVFLDPPYADTAKRNPNLYRKDCTQIAHDVREWAIEQGDDPRLRICLAGYEGEHTMPDSWSVVAWKAVGGYGGQSKTHDNQNAKKERLWFSPHCLKLAGEQAKMALFDHAGVAT